MVRFCPWEVCAYLPREYALTLQNDATIIERIRDASDIVQVIEQYVALKRAGADFRGLCPFHKEKSPSFHVRPAEQYFKCFGCGAGGDVFKFLQLYNSMSFSEARQVLADRAGIALEASSHGTSSGTGRAEILRLNKWAAAVFQRSYLDRQGEPARTYVASRGIAPELAERFQLGFAPDSFDFLLTEARRKGVSDALLSAAGLVKSGQGGNLYDAFRNRLIFPILDPSGQILGFGGRTLGDDRAKYLNSSESSAFNKGKLLYGLQQARDAFREKGRAVLVEGYTDVIMAHQHGFREVVATLGTAMTEQHALVLRRYVPQVLLLFDADLAGAKAADRGIEIAVRTQLDVSLARIADGEDPCSFLVRYGATAFEDLLKSALSVLEFKWAQTLRAHEDGQSSMSKLQAVQEFVSFIGIAVANGGVDAIHRGVIVNELSALLGVSKIEVDDQLVAARRKAAISTTASRRAEGLGADQVATEGWSCVSRRPEQAAAVEVLSVVLNETGLFPRDREELDWMQYLDSRDHRIARVFEELIDESGRFTIAELLSRFEEPELASRVVALAEQGRAAGNLQARLENALQRLIALAPARSCAEAGAEILAELATDAALEGVEVDKKLAQVHAGACDYAAASNFAGISKFAKSTGGSI